MNCQRAPCRQEEMERAAELRERLEKDAEAAQLSKRLDDERARHARTQSEIGTLKSTFEGKEAELERRRRAAESAGDAEGRERRRAEKELAALRAQLESERQQREESEVKRRSLERRMSEIVDADELARHNLRERLKAEQAGLDTATNILKPLTALSSMRSP